MTGLSHRTAPLATRESVSFTRDQLPDALETLKDIAGRGVVVSTCNRTEVYTVARDGETGRDALDAFFTSISGNSDLAPHLYTLEQEDAVKHLYRVASSLDSLIIGESEILGQVRDAFGVASRHGTAPGVLAHVFHSALRTGKRARTETAISRNALSTSRACVEISRRAMGDLSQRHALIVGVGEASKLAAQALRDAGIASIRIANRTLANALDLSQALSADVATLDRLPELISEADIVVTSTGAPDFVIGLKTMYDAMSSRQDRPLLMIDLAVPRDVDPAVADLDGITLRTMDDLEAIAEANRRERETEALKVESIVDEEMDRFNAWWASRGMTPTIAGMRHRAEDIRAAEVAKTIAHVEGLTVEHAERLEAMTKSLVKKLLHDPTKALRDRNDESFTQAARELFALDE
ncbi:MAG: glutamyl-tRNA reductase [Chloroflexi bacterium]|nr:glutamyl-tRNA reductase [Chloroflexota bacterium]